MIEQSMTLGHGFNIKHSSCLAYYHWGQDKYGNQTTKFIQSNDEHGTL